MSIPYLPPPRAVVPPSLFMTIGDVVAAYRISRFSVMREIAVGNLEAVRLGRRVLLVRQTTEDFFRGLPSAKN